MLKLDGVTYRCECGCNVFRPHIHRKGRYRCNGCGAAYETEPADGREKES